MQEITKQELKSLIRGNESLMAKLLSNNNSEVYKSLTDKNVSETEIIKLTPEESALITKEQDKQFEESVAKWAKQ